MKKWLEIINVMLQLGLLASAFCGNLIWVITTGIFLITCDIDLLKYNDNKKSEEVTK